MTHFNAQGSISVFVGARRAFGETSISWTCSNPAGTGKTTGTTAGATTAATKGRGTRGALRRARTKSRTPKIEWSLHSVKSALLTLHGF